MPKIVRLFDRSIFSLINNIGEKELESPTLNFSWDRKVAKGKHIGHDDESYASERREARWV